MADGDRAGLGRRGEEQGRGAARRDIPGRPVGRTVGRLVGRTVGRPVGRTVGGGAGRRFGGAGPGDRGLLVETDHTQAAAVVESGPVGGVGEQNDRFGGGELPPPGARVRDVDDRVGSAGLEDGEEGDDQFALPGGADGDEPAGRQVAAEQTVRQPGGARVQFPVGQAVRAGDESAGTGGVAGPLLESVQDGVGGGLAEAYGLGSLRHEPMMPPVTDNGRRSRTSALTRRVTTRHGRSRTKGLDLDFG